MQTRFIKEVVGIIVGKSTEEIVDLLIGKKNVNEFIIAKKLELTINQTRNILYKLSDYGLVSSIRKKDKKKGWYTYFWKIEIFKSLSFLEKLLLKRVNEINHQIKSRKEKQFYSCEKCSIEVTEEKALIHNFICNECGEVYGLKDNSSIIRALEKEKNRFDKELELVGEEIRKEEEKIEKAKNRKLKKEEKEKIEKRRIKRELTKKAKEKEKKDAEKKNPTLKKKAPVKKIKVVKGKSKSKSKVVKKKSVAKAKKKPISKPKKKVASKPKKKK